MTTPARRLRLVAYLRVSTAGQVDRYGLPVQEADARDWAKRNNARIVKVCTDAAVSGTVDALDRDGLTCALTEIEHGRADGIIAASLSRIARNSTVQEAALALVWRAGGRVFTVDSGEILADDPDDPIRTLVRQIMGAIYQFDRATIAVRMRKGRKAKAEAGRYAGGAPAYGQRPTLDHELEDDPAEQAVIARMRDWRAAGDSYATIADRLNTEQTPTKRGKGRWQPATVARVLDPAARQAARDYQTKAKDR